MASRALRRGRRKGAARGFRRREAEQRKDRRVLVAARPFHRRSRARRPSSRRSLHDLRIGVVGGDREDQRSGVADVLRVDIGAGFDQRLHGFVVAHSAGDLKRSQVSELDRTVLDDFGRVAGLHVYGGAVLDQKFDQRPRCGRRSRRR